MAASSSIARLGDLFERAEAEAVHRLGDGRRSTPSICGSAAIASSSICLNFDLADDVELPAGELRGEAHVLALAADGERQLLVGNDELHAPVGLVDDDLVHLGRLDGGDDVARRIAIERHDVDLLAAQLLHDGLHARALHADAGADRIDVRVAAW